MSLADFLVPSVRQLEKLLSFLAEIHCMYVISSLSFIGKARSTSHGTAWRLRLSVAGTVGICATKQNPNFLID